MALSDIEREKDKKRKGRAVDAKTNERWSDKQKLEAVQTYLTLGNLALTSRMLGIPEITLRVWKTTNWWKEVVDDLKVQEKIVLSNKLKQIMEAAQSVVANRLVSGDPVLTQKGEIVYKPVSMKDAHRVAVDSLNQAVMVEKSQGVTDTVAPDSVDKLEALASKFAEFATKKIEQIHDKKRTIDVSVQDVSFTEGEGSFPNEEDQQISSSELPGEELQDVRAITHEEASGRE